MLGAWLEPIDVGRVNAEESKFVVDPKRVWTQSLARVSDPVWLKPVEDRPVLAKVRSLAKPVPASMQGEWLVFEDAEYGVAPGQAAVLYAGDQVLGGGWIAETRSAAADMIAAA